MKKFSGLLLWVASFAVCVFLYLKFDAEGYNNGLDCTFCNKKMPYNLKPHDGFHFSFSLKDEDDYELVGAGFQYERNSFKIKDFLAYGYNDTSVIVQCTDSLNNIKYLISYETGYKSKKGNPEISFKDFKNSNIEQIKTDYQWFVINEEGAINIMRIKFWLLVGSLVSLFFIIRKLVR